MRRLTTALAGAAALALVSGPGWAQEKVIKFGFAQDFTKVYTFVTRNTARANATISHSSTSAAASMATV